MKYDMKFGVFLMQYQTPENYYTSYSDLVEQVILMEKHGYYSALLGERHIYPDGWLELQALLPALAALTTKMRVASHVMLCPLYDPLHVAEYFATLDHITKGRIEFGAGIGYRNEELTAFNVPLSERGSRLEEFLKLIHRLWTEDSVTFNGKHYRYKNVFVSTKPVQKPRPPIYVAGMADAAVIRAARLGDGWATPNNATLSELNEKVELYRKELRKLGKKGEIIVFRETYIAQSKDKAREILEPPLMGLYRKYARWGLTGKATQSEELTFEKLEKAGMVLIGSPDECIGYIEKYSKELNADYFGLRIQFPGMKQKDTVAAIRLWGEKVIPYFMKT